MKPPPNVKGVQATKPTNSRKTMNMDRLVLTAQAILKMKKRMLVVCRMTARPYSSLNGATTKGPKINPIMYTDTTNDSNTGSLLLNCFIINGTAGAATVDAMELPLRVIR